MKANRTHRPKGLVGQLVVGAFFLSLFPVYGQTHVTLASASEPTFTAAHTPLEEVAVVNQPPTASFSFTPSRPVKHYPLTFDASTSTDPDGNITLYTWNFGDTTNSTTTSVITRTYDSTDTYTVTLTVTDNQNAVASTTASVNINSGNVLPTANFTVSPSTAFEADTLTFDATESQDPDVGGGIVSYLWLFGDRTYQNGGNTTVHSYSLYGFYDVRLMVTDNSGAVDSTTHGVNILQGLTVTLSSDKTQGTAPLLVSLNAQASGGQGPYEFSWYFGDGEIALGQTMVHNYTEPGNYHARVGVADSTGHTAFRELTVTVTDTASGGPSGLGLGPVPYVVTGIGVTALSLMVLLLVYAIVARRARQKEPPTWTKSNRPTRKDAPYSGDRRS